MGTRAISNLCYTRIMRREIVLTLRNSGNGHPRASITGAVWERLSAGAGGLLDLSADRLIAFSRLVLAVFALVAIWLDPSQPAAAETATYAILGLYLLYALLALVLAILRSPVERRAAWLVHGVDITTFSLLMHLTDGPTSPFFVLFAFALFSATLRWNWRGALVTGLILTSLYVLLGLAAMPAPMEPNELDTTIIRAGYLVVSAGILIHLGVVRERAQHRIAQLAEWPAEGPPTGGFPALRGSLAHAVDILRAKKAIVLWESAQEPFVYRAEYSPGGGYATRLDPPEQGASLPTIESPLVLAGGAGDALGRRLRELVGREASLVAVAPIRGARFRGLALVLEPSRITMNVLPLTQIVAARIGNEIGHFNLHQELAAEIALSERARVARDVHDGLLQSLAASGMQLRVIADAAPEDLQPRLRTLERVVREQQKQLRALVSSVRGRQASGARFAVRAELAGLFDALEAQWQGDLTLEVTPEDATLPAVYRAHLPLMISEAVANAVRHAGARRLSVRVLCTHEEIAIEVLDDGAGGWRDPAAGSDGLPRSLAERARELGGALTLARRNGGTALRIALPIAS